MQKNLTPRWQQRLNNYKNALTQLESAVALSSERPLSDLEKQGLIQSFEFTHELAWNVIKDYFFDQGNPNITGSRDAVREAFSTGLIIQGELWMEMIKSRNQTSHTYNHQIANEITNQIITLYCGLFKEFLEKMDFLVKSHEK